MHYIRKAGCVLLGILAFLLTTLMFWEILDERISFAQPEQVYQDGPQYHLYTVPETVPEETETEPETQPPTVPEETQPETEAVSRTHYDTVPKYFQTDYPDIRFGSGTMATSGSSVTSIAMVASYLTGYPYSPDQLAGYFADFIGNDLQLLEHISDELQLPWEKAANIDVAIQALGEGKVVIAVMKSGSIFREAQHFVVFTGLGEDGRILVNDPYGPNYDTWSLKNALENGFKRGDLTGGYGGAWIYDPHAMPEEPFLYVKEQASQDPRHPGVSLTQEETDLLARLIWGEAQGEPFEGQQAVAEVILNRLAADNFPDTLQEIIYAEGQFASANRLYLAELTHTQYEAIRRAMYGPYVLPADVVFFATFPVNDNVWGTIGQHTFCYQW